MLDKILGMAGINPQTFLAEFDKFKGEVGQVVAHFDSKLNVIIEEQRLMREAMQRAAEAASRAPEPAPEPAREMEAANHE